MKIIAMLLGLWIISVTLVTSAWSSDWTGRLDLTPNINGFGAASFTDSAKVGGVDKRIWHLDRLSVEEFELDGAVGYNTSRFLGGAEIALPGGGLDGLIDTIDGFHNLPPSVIAAEPYLAHVKTGIIILYNPNAIRGLKPDFIGYKVSVGFGG